MTAPYANATCDSIHGTDFEGPADRSAQRAWARPIRTLLLTGVLALAAACGMPEDGESSDDEPPTGSGPGVSDPLPEAPVGMTTLAGMVVDGPVVGASVTVFDADGNELATEVTDSRARFVVFIPEDAAYPLTVSSVGGVNLTTDADPGFRLEGIVAEAEQQRLVLNPLSTLALKRAECIAVEAGAAPEQRVQRLLEDPAPLAFLERYDFGLDSSVAVGLLTTPPTEADTALSLLLASEAFAEALRRAATALTAAGTPTNLEEVLWHVACDLGDGDLKTASSDADKATLGAFQTALAAVLIETAMGDLRVASREADVTSILEQSVSLTFGLNGAPRLRDMPLSAGFVDVLLRSVHASLALGPTDALFDLYAELFELAQGAPRSALRERIDSEALQTHLSTLLSDAASDPALAANMVEWSTLNSANTLPPQVHLEASPRQLSTRGMESTTLSHSSEHATVCQRVSNGNSGWSGVTGATADLLVGPIERIETFTLRCAGLGGLVEQSLEVLVPPDVRIQFFRADGSLASTAEYGDDLTVGIQLFDVSADQCQFRRSDTQEAVTDGDTLIAAEGLSITANCEGIGGTFINSALLPAPTVPMSLAWTRPTKRDDGTPLTNLIGYRIYHGNASGNYNGGHINVDDPEQLSAIIDVPPGNRYVAVTAISADGLESRFSNEGFTYIR